MSLELDLYLAIEAIRAADNGSGGFAQAGGTGLVRKWIREDDASDRDNGAFPMVRVDTSSNDEADTFEKGRALCRGVFHVFADRDVAYPVASALTTGRSLDIVLKRLRTKFHRVVLTASNDWTWGTLKLLRAQRAASTGKIIHRVVPFEVWASRNSGVA